MQQTECKLEEQQLLIPGVIPIHPLKRLHLDEERVLTDSVPGTWSNGEGASFQVRLGPNYSTTGIKAPSFGSIYEIFAFDGYRTSKKKIKDISRFYKIPAKPNVPGDYDIPPVLIINVLVPNYDPALVGKVMSDGDGYSMVFFGELSELSRTQISSGNLTPALRLYQEFVRGGKNSKYGDCLKCIARILNTKEAGKSYGRVARALVAKYNGTPFLARDSTSLKYVPGKYLAIDLDAHLFGKMAKKGLSKIKDYMDKIVFDFGFVIEGRNDEENPEQILASIRVSKTGGNRAKPFPFEDLL